MTLSKVNLIVVLGQICQSAFLRAQVQEILTLLEVPQSIGFTCGHSFGNRAGKRGDRTAAFCCHLSEGVAAVADIDNVAGLPCCAYRIAALAQSLRPVTCGGLDANFPFPWRFFRFGTCFGLYLAAPCQYHSKCKGPD